MKSLILVMVLISGPAAADGLTYGQCIAMLNETISNKDAIYQALAHQAEAMAPSAGGDADPTRIAIAVNIDTRRAIAPAMQAYVDALATACESKR